MNPGGAAMGRWPFACRDDVVDVAHDEVVRGQSVVLTGEPGVGKSRVLLELCDRLEDSGATVHRVGASTSLSTVPYGAFASVLVQDSLLQGDGEFAILQRAFAELRGDRPLGETVIALDDAHLLDRGSAALSLLAARAGMSVVASLRVGETWPDDITTLWRDDVVRCVELAPFDREQVAQLLGLVLGSTVDAHTCYRLWNVTKGNLLFLRELVRAGIGRGALAAHGDVWVWTGGFDGATRVDDLLRDSMAALSGDVQRVAELLAVGEPLGSGIVVELTSVDALQRAERAGVVSVERIGRRLEVRLVHPMYAQVARASLGHLHRAALASDLATAIARNGLRRTNDELRIAALQLEAGGAADPDLLLKGARQARLYADIELAEALAREAFAVSGSAAAAVTLADVLYWRNRHEEVVALLTSGVLDDAPPKQLVFGCIHLASAFFYGLGQLGEAEKWLQHGIATAGPAFEADLRATHARMLMVAGRETECIAEAESVLALPDAPARARLNAYIALIPALAICGRLDDVERHRGAALELASTAGRGSPTSTGSITVGLFIARIFSGGLPEFDRLLSSMYEDAARRDVDPFRGVSAFLLGRSALAQGRISDAIPKLRESAALIRLRDPGMILPWCLAALAQALGQSDDALGASAVLTELEQVRFAVTRNIEVDVELARAWTMAAAGSRTEAAEIALAVGHVLRAEQSNASAALGYHDALRLGASPHDVCGPLEELANAVNGRAVAAMAAHARAAEERDWQALVDAADTFAELGMPLCAAEALATASQLASDEGFRASAADLRTRATALSGLCGAALTPLLEPISSRDALSALTRKEQEVALMAARGLTKRDIAAALSVSVRTVGNHINHLYAKLGVTSREQLCAALGVAAEQRPIP